jgi:hypothetical protein
MDILEGFKKIITWFQTFSATRLLIIVFILSFFGFVAYQDYNWFNRNSANYLSDGYIILSKSNNSVCFGCPWSLFFPPVSSFVVTHKDHINNLGDGFISVDAVWVFNKDYVNQDPYGTRTLVDCNKKKAGFVYEDLTQEYIKKIDFRSNKPGEPGWDIIEYICSSQ